MTARAAGDLEVVRRVVAKSRAAQGLPATVADAHAVERIAALFRCPAVLASAAPAAKSRNDSGRQRADGY